MLGYRNVCEFQAGGNDMRGKMVGGSRKRVWRPEIVEEFYDEASGACTPEYFMSMKDPYRVAPGKKLPICWPFRESRASANFRTKIRETKDEWEGILKNNNINLAEFRMHNTVRQGFASGAKDTFIVLTHDEPTEFWPLAATKIIQLLERVCEGPVRVEIRNEKKMYQDISRAPEPGTAKFNALKLVKPLVLACMKSISPSSCTIISFLLRGVKGSSTDPDDFLPTILITVPPGLRALWGDIQKQLEDVIPQDLQVCVEIIPGLLQAGNPAADKPHGTFEPTLALRACNGSSIGPRDSSDSAGSAGTLGIWVWYKGKGATKMEACFLTCYHVIAAGEQGAIRESSDKNGIGLYDAAGKNLAKVERPIVVDYPAKIDADVTTKMCQEHITKGEDTRGDYAKILQVIEEYKSDNRGIGKVIHASGIQKSSTGSRRDWAIVKMNPRFPYDNNIPPARNQFSHPMLNGFDKTSTRHYANLGQPSDTITKVRHFDPAGSEKAVDWVCKIGRGTGITSALVNQLHAIVVAEDGTFCPEVQVISVTGDTFVIAGDTGALVMNLKRECVGMLWGWTDDVTAYFTPIADIFKDVERRTGGEIGLLT